MISLATELYALVSAGHDRLPYCVDRDGPAVVRRTGGKLAPVHEFGGGGEERPAWLRARELRDDGTLTDRLFNPWTVAKHLEGAYSVAVPAPGWVECVTLDIDAHAPSGASRAEVAAAQAQADRVLGDVWAALACDATRRPIVQRTPRGGYHVTFPLTRDGYREGAQREQAWPAAFAAGWFARHLEQAGLELAPGVLEVFPSGRALRVPCGRGMRLLQVTWPDSPESLGVVVCPGTVRYQTRADGGVRVVRHVAAQARTYIRQFQAQRRSIAEWLGRPEAKWHPTHGFLGWRGAQNEKKQAADAMGQPAHYRQSDDVLGPPGGGAGFPAAAGVAGLAGGAVVANENNSKIPAGEASRFSPGLAGEQGLHAGAYSAPLPKARRSVRSREAPEAEVPAAAGKLVKGAAFRAKVRQLLAHGVTEPSTRHDAVLTLSFYWGATCGRSVAATLAELETWCRAHAHAGSTLAPRDFVATCVREATSYLLAFQPLWRFKGHGDGGGQVSLAAADAVVLDAIDPRVRDEATALLCWLAGRADAQGWVAQPVELAGGLIDRLCPVDRRLVIDGKSRRRTRVAIEALERLGVLTLAKNYIVGRQGKLFSCWYQFGSGVLPQRIDVAATEWAALAPRTPATDDAPLPIVAENAPPVSVCVVGVREVPEGLLQVLSAGVRGEPRARLLSTPDSQPAVTASADAPARPPWWARMYLHRSFTPDELRAANFATVVPFPDRPPRPPRYVREPAEVVPLRPPPGVITPSEIAARARRSVRAARLQ